MVLLVFLDAGQYVYVPHESVEGAAKTAYDMIANDHPNSYCLHCIKVGDKPVWEYKGNAATAELFKLIYPEGLTKRSRKEMTDD